jgi:hypothetical protein
MRTTCQNTVGVENSPVFTCWNPVEAGRLCKDCHERLNDIHLRVVDANAGITEYAKERLLRHVKTDQEVPFSLFFFFFPFSSFLAV